MDSGVCVNCIQGMAPIIALASISANHNMTLCADSMVH